MKMRGIAAIMLAIGVIGCLCLLAVARLSPATLTSPIGLVIGVVVLLDLIAAIWVLKACKD